jgi:Ca-activated chloride channel family protein
MTTIVETGRDTKHTGCGGRLVRVAGRSLPLRGAALEAEAGGGLARSILRQTFRNDHTEPLEVLYTFPLPADGAVAA